MSHYKLKTKYNTEGGYGTVEEKTVFAHHNLGCDIVTFYDHDGEYIMSVPDTIDNNILDAINELYYPFTGSRGELGEGIEHMSQEERNLVSGQENRDIHPLTIISDRYHGTYSGANFLAFHLDPEDIPSAIGGGDGEEMSFWESEEASELLVGKGRTVQQAFNDLYNQINEGKTL